MQSVVMFDSMYGTTESLARAIAAMLAEAGSVQLVDARHERPDTAGINLLVVGGPTQGHGVSPRLRALLDRLPVDAVAGLAVATFDTRLSGPRWLTGSASKGIARRLVGKGARPVAPPESFLFAGSHGPLAAGELERARAWARALPARLSAGVPASA